MKAVISSFFTLLLLPLFVFADTVMVIDAGSTGTRAYVYVYETSNDRGQITVTKIIDKKVSPAVTAVTDFDAYFNTLLTAVQTDLVINNDTPITLFATAGIRMLPQADQDALLANIRTALAAQAIAFSYPDLSPTINDDVRVISAAEEAYFIWINDQYVSGKLESFFKPKNTFLAVEMGGASAEVAVLNQNGSPQNIPFTHFGHKYNIYSAGYDGSGQDKAIAALFNTYNSHGGNFAACFPEGAPYPLVNPVLTGTGDFAQCAAFIQANPVNEYSRAPLLSFRNQYLLSGSFYYTFKILGLADDANPQWVSLSDLQTAATDFCATSWDQLQTDFPSESTNYLVNYCFNSAFQQHYLSAIGVTKYDELLSADKYNGQSMTWTLGVAYELVKNK